MHGQQLVLRTKILEALREAGAQFSEEVDTEMARPRTRFASSSIHRPTPPGRSRHLLSSLRSWALRADPQARSTIG